MKSSFLLIFILAIMLHVVAEGQNRKPKIKGQDPVSTNEDESVTVLMSHLDVEDEDDWFYPWGFTMTLYAGSNYTLQGHIVIPNRDFSGVLKVPVTVHDGQDESNRFDFQITVNPVNDKPVITGHSALTTNENQSIMILTEHLRVTDPDDKYPDDFVLRVHSGNNYSVSGTQVTPNAGFSGNLSVNVSVNDGSVESDMYALPVVVNAINRVPEINGQATLQVNEDASITILLTHLNVTDQDNNYPEGFTLTVSGGQNYTFSNTTVTPTTDFFGRLTVPVTVNDGKNTSKPFNLSITVTPVNDIPVITALETQPLFYVAPDKALAISNSISVTEVDGDSIMFAEVALAAETYEMSSDKLGYTPKPNSKIRAVFDASSGILTLLGQASPASYAAALKSVYYQSVVPIGNIRKRVRITVNDGKANSQPGEREIVFGQASVSLDIPTGFTPNGDLSNDTWKIIPLKAEESYSQARIKVYNKSGILVYESVGFDREWDGKMDGQFLPADTYFYTIDLNINAAEGFIKGLVTILR